MKTYPTKLKPFKRKVLRPATKQHYKSVEAMVAKKQKLEMIEALIMEHEDMREPDVEEIRALKKRANDVRQHLRVLSTVVWRERP